VNSLIRPYLNSCKGQITQETQQFPEGLEP
jgi:hypothetical protein